MSQFATQPAYALSDADSLCLQFLTDIAGLTEREQNDLCRRWQRERVETDSLVQHLIRHGVFHTRLLAELQNAPTRRTPRTTLSLLFIPEGWAMLQDTADASAGATASPTLAISLQATANTVRATTTKRETARDRGTGPAPDENAPRELLAESIKRAAAGTLVHAENERSPATADTIAHDAVHDTPVDRIVRASEIGEPSLPDTEPLANLPLIRRKRRIEQNLRHSSQLREGMRFGPYVLGKQLGRGSIGIVFEATDVLLSRTVAVKVLMPEMAARDSAWSQRFLQQARLASKLEHPAILSGFSVGQQRGLYFYAMRLLRGGSTKDRLQAAGPFSRYDATRIIHNVAEILDAVHSQGLAHGNLKPSNIFVDEAGSVFLADFSVPGIPSSERLAAPSQQDLASDFRLLGATYHWLLTGRPPGPAITELASGEIPGSDGSRIDPCLRLIAKAMARNVALGFTSAAQLAAELACLEGELTQDQPQEDQFTRQHPRRPRQVNSLAAVEGAKGDRKVVGVGQMLGKCLLLERLGQGGSGMVFRARHQSLNIPVAVKVLHITDETQNYGQLASEARLLAQINHPHIVRVWDFEDDPEFPYLVLEYVEGINLSELVAQMGRLPAALAVQIITQIADGLGAAYRLGIIHRDVKPNNILLANDGTVKLADLGLAMFLDDEPDRPKDVGLAGTVAYMPPEQAISAAKADHRSDIYALGATLYHLLTGQIPFPGATRMEVILKHSSEVPTPPHELAPELPPEISDVVLKMMAKDPVGRYQTYDELLQALLAVHAQLSDQEAQRTARHSGPNGSSRLRLRLDTAVPFSGSMRLAVDSGLGGRP